MGKPLTEFCEDVKLASTIRYFWTCRRLVLREVPRILINDCWRRQRLLATTAMHTALRELADPNALAEERSDASRCLFEFDWTRDLARYASAREMSRRIRCSSQHVVPDTLQHASACKALFAKQALIHLSRGPICEAGASRPTWGWRSVEGGGTAQPAEWRALIDSWVLKGEASRQSRREMLAQSEELAIFNPADLRETGREFPDDV